MTVGHRPLWSDAHLQRMALAVAYRWEPVGPQPCPRGERRAAPMREQPGRRSGWFWTDEDLEQMLVRYEATRPRHRARDIARAYCLCEPRVMQLVARARAKRVARTQARALRVTWLGTNGVTA